MRNRIFFICSIIMADVVMNVSTCFALSNDNLIKKFKAAYPYIPVESVALSPIEGLFEIETGNNIVYYYPEKNIIITCDIILNGKNLTYQRKLSMLSEKVKEIPLEKAIRIGNGKHTVIEFTDPDCAFCRRSSEYFKARNDISKYIFFYPLTKIHPKAESKAKYVLNADNKEKAYYDVMGGFLDNKELSKEKFSEQASVLLAEHIKIANKLNITGTPTFWINNRYVSGADIELFNEILGAK